MFISLRKNQTQTKPENERILPNREDVFGATRNKMINYQLQMVTKYLLYQHQILVLLISCFCFLLTCKKRHPIRTRTFPDSIFEVTNPGLVHPSQRVDVACWNGELLPFQLESGCNSEHLRGFYHQKMVSLFVFLPRNSIVSEFLFWILMVRWMWPTIRLYLVAPVCGYLPRYRVGEFQPKLGFIHLPSGWTSRMCKKPPRRRLTNEHNKLKRTSIPLFFTYRFSIKNQLKRPQIEFEKFLDL